MQCCKRQPFSDYFEYLKWLRSGVQPCSLYSPTGIRTAFAPTSLVKDQDNIVLNNTEDLPSNRAQKTRSKFWDDPEFRVFLPHLKALSYILQNVSIFWVTFSNTFKINAFIGQIILSTLNAPLQRRSNAWTLTQRQCMCYFRPLNAITFGGKLEESDLNMLSLKKRVFLNLKKGKKISFLILLLASKICCHLEHKDLNESE